jgi:hypothetical protein
VQWDARVMRTPPTLAWMIAFFRAAMSLHRTWVPSAAALVGLGRQDRKTQSHTDHSHDRTGPRSDLHRATPSTLESETAHRRRPREIATWSDTISASDSWLAVDQSRRQPLVAHLRCDSNRIVEVLVHADCLNTRIPQVRAPGVPGPADTTNPADATTNAEWASLDGAEGARAGPCDGRRAAVRFLRLEPLRIAPVVGRLFAIDDAEKHGHIVLVLPEVGVWEDKPGRMLGITARWWTVSELRSQRVAVEPPQLLDLADGYWDGWLPDGEVSLV